MPRLLWFLLIALLLPIVPARAQPVPGVVWKVPDDLALAADDLEAMREAGFRAVRTGLITDEALLRLADTLGLQLYQELPIAYLPAAALADSLEAAGRLLEQALVRARRHASARHFGLARYVDTSNPAACAYFEQLAALVRAQGPPGSRTFYVTPLVEQDRCAAQVDLVLLNTLDMDDPAARVAAWRAAHPEGPAAGIAALGTWVRADSLRGLRVPHSPEAQARYLEERLPALLADSSLAALFLYRWREVGSGPPSPLRRLENPNRQGYGLRGPGNTPRPAFAVAAGILTGTQTVFAFPQGEAVQEGWSWRVLFGWLVVLMLGALYAGSPRFRVMVQRFFTARGFYREAVREGRDVLLGVSSVLLLALALSVGILTSLLLELLRGEEAFGLLYRWLPERVQELLATLLNDPALLVALIACVYALGLVLWTLVLLAAARRRYPLAPGQALMLVVWPRWPLLLLMVVALVLGTLPEAWVGPAALGLGLAALLVTVLAVLRTLVDYASVARVPAYQALLVGLGNPLVLLAVVAVFGSLEYGPEVQFLWHLATRT